MKPVSIGVSFCNNRRNLSHNRKLWLLITFLLAISGNSVWSESCAVVAPHTLTDAERAYLAADYDKAVALYQAELRGQADDPALTAGLVQVLLHQQKVREAEDAVAAGLAAHPNSAILLTARAEVQLREGKPWEAGESIGVAMKAGPCLPRAHLIFARLAGLSSYHASARSEIQVARKLDAFDPDIWSEWIGTLPRRARAEELEKYLKAQTGDDAEERHHTQLYLDQTRKRLEEPHKPCRLVSTVTAAEIPFAALMYDATRIRAFGLDVKLNQKKARLEIDTGAGGLTISRSVAQRAGLKEFAKTEVGGVGDEGENAAYTAFVDSIQIGNLEFHDCAVEVVANKNMLDVDGLIGMDVFSKFLVSLNYPERKLTLGPLPPRPGEAVAAPTLGTESDDDEDVAGATKDSSGPEGAPTPKGLAATDPGSTAGADAGQKSSRSKGPYNRYIAPEMMEYTPVYREGHLLMLPVALDHSKLRLFVLDTGAWATSISPAAAREVTKVHSDYSTEVRGLSGKVEKMYTANEVTFSFARVEQKIREVPSFDLSKVSKNVGMEVSGFLGARTLQLVTIHIDYRDGLVKFDYDPKKIRYYGPL